MISYVLTVVWIYKKKLDENLMFIVQLSSSPWGNRTPLSRMKILRPNR